MNQRLKPRIDLCTLLTGSLKGSELLSSAESSQQERERTELAQSQYLDFRSRLGSRYEKRAHDISRIKACQDLLQGSLHAFD
jgi:hypothetical protein